MIDYGRRPEWIWPERNRILLISYPFRLEATNKGETEMAIKTFPQVVFISIENAGTPDEFISASLNTDEAIGDDDSKIVGVYKFTGANELRSRPPLSTERRSRKTTK